MRAIQSRRSSRRRLRRSRYAYLSDFIIASLARRNKRCFVPYWPLVSFRTFLCRRRVTIPLFTRVTSLSSNGQFLTRGTSFCTRFLIPMLWTSIFSPYSARTRRDFLRRFPWSLVCIKMPLPPLVRRKRLDVDLWLFIFGTTQSPFFGASTINIVLPSIFGCCSTMPTSDNSSAMLANRSLAISG